MTTTPTTTDEKPRLFGRLAWYRRRVEALEQQTVVDDLTGLRNQRALWRELSRRTRHCSPAHPLAVLMVDFDLFKEINEGYGHAVGDAVLRRGAAVLRDAATSPRLVFRYGGEEFVLLTEGDRDARDLAERVRTDISQQNGALPAVTVSCGIAELDAPVEPWVALDRADAALREAKRAGRNRVVVANATDPSPSAYLVEKLEDETARRAAVALAVATLEVRDRDTADHSDGVLTLCEALGRRLGLRGAKLEQLLAGAQLHDVGKIAVPSSILNKAGPLTDDEWAVIREHTVIGERILRSVPEMAEVATIVRHSHEHWDGGGYPDGLAGEEIPLASRVILCADAFHAIRSDRPYREGKPARAALVELQACAGTQLDPTVVDALVAEAADARQGRAGGAIALRKRRLVVLLTTVVIGTGSAVAAIPEVRDAIRSLFGSSVPPSVAASDGETAQGFGFGPLGDLLSLEGAAERDRAREGKRSKSTKDARRGEKNRSAGRGQRSAGGEPGGTGELQTTPRQAPEPPATPGAETGSPPGPAPLTTHNGPGGALGHSLPTPRRPVQAPPNKGGRADPPALGLSLKAAPHGKAKGHHK